MLRRLRELLATPVFGRRPGDEARSPAARASEKGIALILVMGMLVLMTSFVVEFQFNSRIRYQLAANYRDQVRARYIAQSGINIYRLLVMAIYNAQGNDFVAAMLENTGLDLSTVLTQLIPQLDTGLLRFMSAGFAAEDVNLGGDGGATLKDGAEENQVKGGMSANKPIESSLSKTGSAGFLDFEGDFYTVIEPEDRKVNINALATGELDTNAAFTALWGIMMDQRYTKLFRDKNITPRELIGNLKDWIDPDGDVSAGQGGYEDNHYSRLKDPYNAKNARFTSVSEVHMVQGWDDTFYALFAPHMTIYGTDTVNPNHVSSDVLRGLIRAYCKGGSVHNDATIDLALSSDTWRIVKETVQFSTGKEVASLLTSLPGLGDCSEMAEHLGFDTRAYRLTSTGSVGDVEKTIEVVVDNRSRPLYWREN